MDKEIVGKKLKFIREINDLTMDELKDKFNKKYGSSVSKSMISNWENGRYLISNKNLSLYTSLFDIPLHYFALDEIDTSQYDRVMKDYMWTKKLTSKVDFSKVIENFQEMQNPKIATDKLLKAISKIDDNIIKNYIDDNINKLNSNGLVKVLLYTNDIIKLDEYRIRHDDNSKE